MQKRKAIIGLWMALALAAAAQTAKTVRLATMYTPNSWLLYSISVDSTLNTTSPGAAMHATLKTVAEAQLHVLPGAATNNFAIAARFTKYVTTVESDNAAQKAELQKQAAASDQAANAMKAAVFQVRNGQFSIQFREPGDSFDQPVDMLSELVRNDDLPSGPVAVGAQWTRMRQRAIPKTPVSMQITLHCRLGALNSENGAPTAAIVVDSSGNANLPPGSLPDSQELASKGLVPLGKFDFHTDVTSDYRIADGVLMQTTSHTHSNMNLQFIGPSPEAASSNSQIDSTGAVKLEKIVAARPSPGSLRQ